MDCNHVIVGEPRGTPMYDNSFGLPAAYVELFPVALRYLGNKIQVDIGTNYINEIHWSCEVVARVPVFVHGDRRRACLAFRPALVISRTRPTR